MVSFYNQTLNTLKKVGVKFKKGEYEISDVKREAIKHKLMKPEEDFNDDTYQAFYGFKTIKTRINDKNSFLKENKKFISDTCLSYS